MTRPAAPLDTGSPSTNLVLDLADARILSLDRRLADCLGFVDEDLVGRVVTEFWSDHDSRAALWTAALSPDDVTLRDVSLTGADGRVLHARMRCRREALDGRRVLDCSLDVIRSSGAASSSGGHRDASYRSLYLDV